MNIIEKHTADAVVEIVTSAFANNNTIKSIAQINNEKNLSFSDKFVVEVNDDEKYIIYIACWNSSPKTYTIKGMQLNVSNTTHANNAESRCLRMKNDEVFKYIMEQLPLDEINSWLLLKDNQAVLNSIKNLKTMISKIKF